MSNENLQQVTTVQPVKQVDSSCAVVWRQRKVSTAPETVGQRCIRAFLVLSTFCLVLASALAHESAPEQASGGVVHAKVVGGQYWQLVFAYDSTSLSLVRASEMPAMDKRVETPGLAGAVGVVTYAADWLDGAGKTMKTSSLDVPLGQRVALRPGRNCKSLIPQEGVVVVRALGPASKSAIASLRLHRVQSKIAPSLAARIPASFTRDEVQLPVQQIKRLGSKIAPPPGPLSSVKIQNTGADTNRLVIAVMAEGYTAANLSAGSFTSATQTLLTAFNSKSPWDILLSGTNVYRVNVESNQQGADRQDGQNGTMVDTYFNSTFWTSGIDRLLSIDGTGTLRAIDAADAFVGPGVWDYIFVLVNSTVYGGSGGFIGVSSVHPSSSEVAIHEFGHTFAGLADEYTSAYPGYPAGDPEPNVDYDYLRANLKWSAWVDVATPLPTPDNSSYDGVVGAFQGARYLTSGIYRPTRNCLMKSLGVGLCPVCKEAHIVDYFNFVSLADALSPAASSTINVTSSGASFTATPLSIPGLTYEWKVNGTTLSSQTGSSVTLYPADLPTQTSTLQLTIAYPTALVRSTSISQSYSWTVTRSASAAPTATITLSDANPTNADAVHFGVQFSANVSPTFTASDVTVTGSLASGATVGVSGSDPNYTVTVTPASASAEGTIGITLGTGITDSLGNAYAGGSSPASYTIDNTRPTIGMGAPSSTLTKSGPVTYTLTYSGADTVNLTSGNVSLVTTGTATGSVSVSGSGTTTRTVTISSITGTGTLAIAVAAGTASDAAGNLALSVPTGTAFTVDNTAPTISVSGPSASSTKSGPVSYTVTYGGADSVSLVAGNVSLVTTGTATGSVSVSGSGTTTRTVTVSSITGDGTLRISIGASTASDLAGNLAPSAPSSSTFTVDNTAPTISVSGPSASTTKSGPVSYTVTYGGADTVSLVAGNVSLVTTGTATGSVSVSGSGTTTRTVTVSSITGTGTLAIAIAAGTASDTLGNAAPSAPTSTACTVDNTAPTISVSSPSATSTKSGPVSYTVTYGGADTVSLTSGDVSLVATGTATGSVSVSGSGTTTRTVTISSITGDGTLAIAIAASTASDTLGNAAPSAPTSSACTVDNTAPTISVSGPSAITTKSGPVSYTVTYGEADTVSLVAGNVSLVTTGTATGSVSVSGSGTTSRTVTISSITGDGTLRISIAASTASDLAGNLAPSAPSSTTFTVDNTAPTTALASPETSPTKKTSFACSVTFSDSVTGFTASGIAATNATVSNLSGSGTSYTFDVAPATAGVFSVNVPAGRAADAAGNSNTASNTLSWTYDPAAPTVILSTVAPNPTKTSPLVITVQFSESVTGFATADISATNASVSGLAGSGAFYSFNLTPAANGAVSVQIAGNCVQDSAGNVKAASNVLTRTDDTVVPAITLLGANPLEIGINSTFSDPGGTAADSVSGDLTSRIVVNSTVNTAVAATYTVTYDVSDDAGNAAVTKSRTVVVSEDNHAPVLESIGAQTALSGQLLNIQIAATDIDGTTPLLSATGLPAGAAFSDAHDGSGQFSWTPTGAQLGDYSVTFTATDADDESVSDSETVVITVLSGTPATLYVDNSSQSPTADGSAASPFKSIGAALGAAVPDRGDTVLVKPGTYAENLLLKTDVALASTLGAQHTVIAGASLAGDIVTAADGASVVGFTIGSDAIGAAVFAPTNAAVHVSNCVLLDCAIGVYADSGADVSMENLSVIGCTQYGVYADPSATLVTLKNCIFSSNATAVNAVSAQLLDSSHNLYFENQLDATEFQLNPSDLVLDPRFVDTQGLNFHLQLDSPCRDAGDPAGTYNDKNGTQNDIGADGGPAGVQDTTAPAVSLVISPPNGYAPLPVTFDASASNDEWGIYTYAWTIDAVGKQFSFSDPVVNFTYTNPGTYVVALTITDGSGNSTQTSQTITVGDGQPVVNASADTNAGPAPLTIGFQALASDPDGGAVTYAWDFNGDGTADSSQQNPAYTFPAGTLPGAYDVLLTVTDAEGLETQSRIPVTVTAGPLLAHAVAQPGVACDLAGAGAWAGLHLSLGANALSDQSVVTLSQVASVPAGPVDSNDVVVEAGPSQQTLVDLATVSIPIPDSATAPDPLTVLGYDAANGLWSSAGISNVRLIAGTPRLVVFETSRLTTFAIPVTQQVPAKLLVVRITISSSGSRAPITVTGRVTVMDNAGHPIPGATVFAKWTMPDGSQKAVSAMTSSKGVAKFTVKGPIGTYKLTVTNVVANGYVFDSAASVVKKKKNFK